MRNHGHANYYGLWYLNELGARVVAQSGRPSDRFHLGKLMLLALKDAQDFVLQIDGATGQSETCGSVLERSVQCANALRALNLQTGDVIVLMAPNHLDLCIPYYAALYLGIAIASIDRTLGSERAEAVRTALDKANLKSKIVTFDEAQENNEELISLAKLLKLYGQDVSVEDFKASDFDTDTTLSFIISTSGSMGVPKQAAHTHKTITLVSDFMWVKYYKFPTPTRMALLVSPLQWGTAILQFNLSVLFRYTRLQTSKDIDEGHAFHLINTYKPTMMVISPNTLASLVKRSKGRCEWTSYETILVAGGAVPEKLINEMKELSPDTEIYNGYGLSELGGPGFVWTHVPKSLGRVAGMWQYRLVNPDTQEDITEPNVPGELWIKGPAMFKGYYKDEETTRATVTVDGWLKTGDLQYRDEHWNFFFVDRIKLLLKYKNHQVSPEEIQLVIRQHPAVVDVVVRGLPDEECGDLPVAVIVKRTGHSVSAEEIKQLVKENLTDTKQLRGGVIFLDALPLLPSGKVDNKQLKELVMQMEKE